MNIVVGARFSHCIVIAPSTSLSFYLSSSHNPLFIYLQKKGQKNNLSLSYLPIILLISTFCKQEIIAEYYKNCY